MGGFGVSRGTPAECSKPGRCVDGEMRNCEAKKAQDSDADQSCSGCQTPAERRRPGRRPLPRAERGLPYRSESPGDWHIVHRGHTNRFMPGPVRWFRAVIAAVGIFASGTACLGQTQQRYPGTSWQQLSPAQSGWSPKWLAAAEEWSRAIGSSAVVVVQHGAIVASWGDTNADLLLNSARKSLLSALIGIAVAKHQIDLNATMGELGIDDNPPALTQSEKQATVLDLLEAQSGVYHAANYETPLMAAKRPPRGSHPPGTFWYYNNWDFNALGSIYQHAAGESVFSAFAQQIATPLQMQDFDPEVQVCRRGRFEIPRLCLPCIRTGFGSVRLALSTSRVLAGQTDHSGVMDRPKHQSLLIGR